MNKLYFIIAVFILLIFNVLMIFNSRNLKIKLTNTDNKFNLLKENQHSIFKEWERSDSLEFLANNVSLKGDVKLKKKDGSTILLKTLSKTPKIVLCLPEFSCTPCYEESLTHVREFFDKINNENTIIISKYKNIRELHSFIRLNKFSCDVYNLKNENLGLVIENEKRPYIFVLDESLKSNDLFLIKKELPDLTNVYLNYIYEKNHRSK